MSIESTSESELRRADELGAILDGALKDAAAWEFDEPSAHAIARTRDLLGQLAKAFPRNPACEVAIAVDGSLEVTIGGRETYVSVTVSPDGRRLDSATINASSRAVTWEAQEPNFSDLVREIERAA